MKKIILLLLILFSKVIFSQEIRNEWKEDLKLWVNTAPLALIDAFAGPSYRLGFEFKLYRNVSLSLEAGKYYSYDVKGGLALPQKGIHGFIIRPEIKFYLNDEKNTLGNYIAIEYLHKEITFNYTDSIAIKPMPKYEKTYTIYKAINCFSFKYGEVSIIKKHFVFEWYVGAGIRIAKGNTTLTSDEEAHILAGENHGDIIGAGQRSPTYILPNLNFGIKLGYKIK